MHPEWSMDSDYFLHKFGKAGLNYELGIAITTSRLVWMNGPFRAGTSDARVFKKGGLLNKLEECGKKCIGCGVVVESEVQFCF